LSSIIRTIYVCNKDTTTPKRVVREVVSLAMHHKHTIVIVCIVVLLSGLLALPFQAPPGTARVISHQSHRPSVLSAGAPNVTLTYTSLWNSTKSPVHPGDSIAGDHIVLHSRWSPTTSIVRSRIEVNATVVPKVISNESAGAEVSIDTRALGNNFTCTINMTAWLDNGSYVHEVVENVFLGNFFVPHVRVLSPNGGEVWTGVHNITWEAWDKNADETLTFDVLVSAGSGQPYTLLASGLTNNSYAWDCSDFAYSETYIVEIRVFDGIYTSSDQSDGYFTAGGLIPTTTATSTTATTTANTTTGNTIPTAPVNMVGTFLAALILSSAILSVIVYYSAKKWF